MSRRNLNTFGTIWTPSITGNQSKRIIISFFRETLIRYHQKFFLQVIVGKSTNFFLFCFCSRHFRRRLSRLCFQSRQERKYAKTTLSARIFETTARLNGWRKSSQERDRFLTKSTTSRNICLRSKKELNIGLLQSRRMSRSLISVEASHTIVDTLSLVARDRIDSNQEI